ncbi:unnamed protein product [Lymnaea stagnalis]|uniref:FZ domain-containing protein n=1 Tax=Lymnaea stagnalis TaxID=6523 RepID=A0AAV2HSP0_LYMST
METILLSTRFKVQMVCISFSMFFVMVMTSDSVGETIVSSRCEPVRVPMCQGLVQYNATKLPNKFGHTTQSQVYWALQPWWPFVDAGCSDNLRNFLCSLYLPKCVGDDQEPHYPCVETCKKAKVKCKKLMRLQNTKWGKDFKCAKLLPKDSHRCIKPEREGKKKQNKEQVLCQKNPLPMCQGIPLPLGSLPNIFLQGDPNEIAQEMRQYQSLVDSGCSKKLQVFLCGVYMPYCVDGQPGQTDASREHKNLVNKIPFVLPCKELCQEVYDQCSGEYQQRTHGLPWPAKFHCHRFSAYADRYPSNTTTTPPGGDDEKGPYVPCTMPPFNIKEN